MKLGIHAYDITLYKSYDLLSMSNYFRCYGKLKFPQTYNGIREKNGLIGDILFFLQKCLLGSPPYFI